VLVVYRLSEVSFRAFSAIRFFPPFEVLSFRVRVDPGLDGSVHVGFNRADVEEGLPFFSLEPSLSGSYGFYVSLVYSLRCSVFVFFSSSCSYFLVYIVPDSLEAS
jgi:hypothetical protein